MCVTVLRTRPNTRYLLPRHFPPAVLNMLKAHMTHLAGTLPKQQDELQGRADNRSGIVERGPHHWNFAGTEYAFAVPSWVALHQLAWIVEQNFFAHRPRINCRDSGQRLIGGYRSFFHATNQRLDISARDGIGR